MEKENANENLIASKQDQPEISANPDEIDNSPEKNNDIPIKNSTEDLKLIFQELGKKYVKENESGVNRADVPKLLAEFQENTGETIGEGLELIVAMCNIFQN